jgi:hypothetical protein
VMCEACIMAVGKEKQDGWRGGGELRLGRGALVARGERRLGGGVLVARGELRLGQGVLVARRGGVYASAGRGFNNRGGVRILAKGSRGSSSRRRSRR